jgi:hypothetical protein
MLHVQKAGNNMRPSQTFQKRQRELARQEKQRTKAQRKAQRKLEKQASPAADVFGEPTDVADTPESPRATEEVEPGDAS